MNYTTNKIKVVWLCHFSNVLIHSKLDLQIGLIERLIFKLLHKPISTSVADFAVWVSYGISEMEKSTDVELHVISPYPHLKNKTQEFVQNGIYYHFFKDENDNFIRKIINGVFHVFDKKYKINRRQIAKFISKIRPDIVHLIGAENPYYSLGILDVPKDIITIAQLQTLMNDDDFITNYPINDKEYNYRSSIELKILQSVDFVGTIANKYRKIIKSQIKPDAIILNTNLALNEPIVNVVSDKSFDFVYFASNINKAADYAIEAFGLAHNKDNHITLDIIGGYDIYFKKQLDMIINKYGIADAVTFEGKLTTHEDVLKHIRKSRFALLPLKVDLTSGTIREAMSNGLPVLTTDTGELGTQKLNSIRQTVLISPIGDHQALADNMLKILKTDNLADMLRQNAFESRSETNSNEMVIRKYVDIYKACLDYRRNGAPMPLETINI